VIGQQQGARAGLVGSNVRVVTEEREERIRGGLNVLRRSLPREL
jgi:hypothetical protein